MITANQIRAARGLLDWTQTQLAKKSGLSLRAINSIERGLTTPRPDNLGLIRQAFEKEGIEFGDYDGTRRQTERLELLKLEGASYVDQHLIDIMQEMRVAGTEILYNIPSEEDFADMRADLLDQFFQHLSRHKITERFLIAQGEIYIISQPSAYRWLKRESFNHVGYIVYGDNVAFQILNTPHRMIIIRNPGIADMFRRQFEANWAGAEVPWFAKEYKIENQEGPWSSAKGDAARKWVKAKHKH